MRRLSSYKNKFGNDWARILSSPVDVVRSEEYKMARKPGMKQKENPVGCTGEGKNEKEIREGYREDNKRTACISVRR